MKTFVAGLLASIATVGLLSACSSDTKVTLPTSATVPTGISLPPGVTLPTGLTLPDVSIPDNATIPAGISVPTDLSVPAAAIDAMITQLAAAGMKVDKTCFTNLLKDDSLRKLVTAGGTPSPDVLQKFFACITTS